MKTDTLWRVRFHCSAVAELAAALCFFTGLIDVR
jgi:hypothetical protein